MRASLDMAREEADRARAKLAEASAREADHARRFSLIHEELAEARAEIVALNRHLEHSEALRAEIAGHLFEGGAPEDVEELIRLRQKALSEDQRALVSDRTVARLRERVQELVSSRETLLTRVAEWQQLIREDGPEAADLSEFLAELRSEILDLEHRNVIGDAREAALRERLALAGVDPDRERRRTKSRRRAEVEVADEVEMADEVEAADEVEVSEEVRADEVEVADNTEGPDEAETAGEIEAALPAEPSDAGDEARERRSRTDVLAARLRNAGAPMIQTDLLLQIGRSGDAGAVDTVHPWTGSSEPSVRAAAFEALGRLLERAPSELEPHLRRGLADPDPRVRRRVVLATATARGLAAHALLDPLREDADPQVRRVIRQVLRQNASAGAQIRARPQSGTDPEGEAPALADLEPEPRGGRPTRPLGIRPSRTVP